MYQGKNDVKAFLPCRSTRFFLRSRYKSISFKNKDEHASLNYSKNGRAVKTLAKPITQSWLHFLGVA